MLWQGNWMAQEKKIKIFLTCLLIDYLSAHKSLPIYVNYLGDSTSGPGQKRCATAAKILLFLPRPQIALESHSLLHFTPILPKTTLAFQPTCSSGEQGSFSGWFCPSIASNCLLWCVQPAEGLCVHNSHHHSGAFSGGS